VSQYQKNKTNLHFTEARNSEWQWHQLGHMKVCTLLQTDNHTSTPPLSFLQARFPSCNPTNSVKALKTTTLTYAITLIKLKLYCYSTDRVIPQWFDFWEPSSTEVTGEKQQH